jgi:hypothetical protein
LEGEIFIPYIIFERGGIKNMAIAITHTFEGSVVDLVELKVTKGNELSEVITETFDGMDFAQTVFVNETNMGDGSAGSKNIMPVKLHGMSLGRAADKAVRVSKQIAALGARQDYIEIKANLTTGSGTSSYAKLVRCLMVQALDYTGVPASVQYAIYGKYSPFVTPSSPVNRGLIHGIDRQEFEAVHNVVCAVDATPKTQNIRGALSERLYATVTGVTGSETALTLKLIPARDGVFVIPRGAILWAGAGNASNKLATAT